MSKRFIIADPTKCTGCGVCELVCSASKDKVFNPRMSRIKVVKIEPLVYTAMACRLCEKPRCVRLCPAGERKALLSPALTQDKETGVIAVDETRCNGCGWCVEACEFGAVTLHPDKRIAVVCDLCGGDPPCVKLCIPGALELTTLDILTERTRRSIIKEFFLEKQSNP